MNGPDCSCFTTKDVTFRNNIILYKIAQNLGTPPHLVRKPLAFSSEQNHSMAGRVTEIALVHIKLQSWFVFFFLG